MAKPNSLERKSRIEKAKKSPGPITIVIKALQKFRTKSERHGEERRQCYQDDKCDLEALEAKQEKEHFTRWNKLLKIASPRYIRRLRDAVVDNWTKKILELYSLQTGEQMTKKKLFKKNKNNSILALDGVVEYDKVETDTMLFSFNDDNIRIEDDSRMGPFRRALIKDYPKKYGPRIKANKEDPSMGPIFDYYECMNYQFSFLIIEYITANLPNLNKKIKELKMEKRKKKLKVAIEQGKPSVEEVDKKLEEELKKLHELENK